MLPSATAVQASPLLRAATLAISFTLSLAAVAPAQITPSAQASSARDCATCHLSWADSFRRPGAVLLVDRPPDSYVSASDSCLGCHDGSVDDDRRRVWIEHGHKTDIVLPAGMKVPDALPLLDGKIACRTCHTAHAGTGPETIATTFFLRMPNDKGQLCMSCHTDYAKEHRMHPIGPMDFPLPKVLVAAGAKAGTDNKHLNCRSCHTPHGQREDHLLVMPAQSSQLCLACHEQIAPGLFRPERGPIPHPQNPPLSSDAQRAALKEMHTRTGTNDTLICLSCHSMHKAKSQDYILADTLENSRFCLRCHPGYEKMISGDHDLRQSAPEAVNLLGETPQVSGPCGACHGFHHFKREPAPAAPDPAGLCLTCHQKGQCAENKTGQPLSHIVHPGDHKLPDDLPLKLFAGFPDESKQTIACLTCHNPHETANSHFLRAKNETLCSTCHIEQAGVVSGPHDFAQHADWKNGRGWTPAQAGTCGFCHAVHDAKGPALWAATPEPPRDPNDLCSACHQPGGLAANRVAGELRHPSGPQTAVARSLQADLPLFDAKGTRSHDGGIACATCHDLHRAKPYNDRLRIPPLQAPETLCITCHVEESPLPKTPHSLDIMHEHLQDMPQLGRHTTCGPCHSVHALPAMPDTGMWKAPLAPDYPPDMARCLGCHSASGGATPMIPTIHPAALIQNVVPPGQAGYMPLFDEQGHEVPIGRIACQTCHIPHGREDVIALAGQKETDVEELRALNPLVRTYQTPNLCSSCHGVEGLSHFLYYHSPEKRRPVTAPLPK